MKNEGAFSMLKKSIDNMSKAFNEFYNGFDALPKYLRTEMLYPKKKPRGSIRRKRKESESE